MTELLNAIAGLIFVLGLIFGLNWLLKRFGHAFGNLAAGSKGEIDVLHSRALDAKNRLSLVRCRGKDFLIASGETILVVESFDAMPDNTREEQRESK